LLNNRIKILSNQADNNYITNNSKRLDISVQHNLKIFKITWKKHIFRLSC